MTEEEIETDLLEIQKRLQERHARRAVAWRRYAAAMAILAVCIGIYVYTLHPNHIDLSAQSQLSEAGATDILPGGNKAVLTLADGRTVTLSSDHEGIIMSEDEIRYSNGDSVVGGWQSAAAGEKAAQGSRTTQYATLTTPKGGQYQLTLPDGSKAWLNAASTLRYPLQFDGDVRMVELEGEAYFEVRSTGDKGSGTSPLMPPVSNLRVNPAAELTMPFVVRTPTQEVTVLGTHFNINSYPDEPAVKTTLVEGTVKVKARSSDREVLLKPGQQASLLDGQLLQVSEVSVAEAVAWKDGLFRFDNTDIETIMRQLSRWYDVEVEFEGKKTDLKLWGEVYRNVNASQVLEMLDYFNLQYRIKTENGVMRIVIYP